MSRGIPDRTSAFSVTVRPPITTVSPSRTSTRDSAFCLRKITPTSEGARSADERSADSSSKTSSVSVIRGVTSRITPVSL